MPQRPFTIELSNFTHHTQSELTEVDQRLTSFRMEEKNLREEARRLREKEDGWEEEGKRLIEEANRLNAEEKRLQDSIRSTEGLGNLVDEWIRAREAGKRFQNNVERLEEEARRLREEGESGRERRTNLFLRKKQAELPVGRELLTEGEISRILSQVGSEILETELTMQNLEEENFNMLSSEDKLDFILSSDRMDLDLDNDGSFMLSCT